MIILDVECYLNYFHYRYSIAIQAQQKTLELYEGKELECKKIVDVLRTFKTLGFNSSNYDSTDDCCALRGDTNQQLKQLSDAIINSEQQGQYCDNSKLAYPAHGNT